MTTSASQQPVKGILKNKSSLACSLVPSAMQDPRHKSSDVLSKKSQRWDEMNILATYYIEDEDIIKVDGPSTPDNSIDSDDEDVFASENFEALNPDMLARKLAAAKGSKPKYLIHEQESSGDEDSDLSPESKKSLLATCCLFFFRCSIGNGEEKLQKSTRAANEKQLEFEIKRKLHDNEGLSLKLARQLVSKELSEVDEEISTPTTGENVNMEQANQTSLDDQQKKQSPSS
uniref:PPP1R2 family member B n=2 Tax=Pipistrellus kuhlii TaxID=59472 RepID=A0A7J7V0Z7_PIPKU|nr:PPP1R2 family member B [Pipistrellus kuhlii]